MKTGVKIICQMNGCCDEKFITHHTIVANAAAQVPGANGKYPIPKTVATPSAIFLPIRLQ